METAEKVEERAAGQKNRRDALRLSVDEDAHLLLLKQGFTVSCRIVDISLNGCRLRTKERFTAGSMASVEVAFKVRGLAFRFSGVIRWTDGRHLAGVRFADVSARRREELVEALSEVEAENAAKAEKQAAERLMAEQQAAEKLAAEWQDAEKLIAEWQAAAQDATKVPPAQPPAPETPPQTPVQAPAIAAEQVAGPSPQKPAQHERRVQAREEVDTSAVIFLVNIAARLRGRILDLSLGGCRIRTDERFPVGIYTRVEAEFRLEGLPFRLGGVVQAIHDRRTVGIRFLDMSSRKREQVTELIEDIREMKEKGLGDRDQGPGTKGLGTKEQEPGL